MSERGWRSRNRGAGLRRRTNGLGPTDHLAVTEHGPVVHHVVANAAHAGCDLVVMGKHGTHLTEELLLGSTTRRVLSECEADLLVVVDPHRPEAAAPAAQPFGLARGAGSFAPARRPRNSPTRDSTMALTGAVIASTMMISHTCSTSVPSRTEK